MSVVLRGTARVLNKATGSPKLRPSGSLPWVSDPEGFLRRNRPRIRQREDARTSASSPNSTPSPGPPAGPAGNLSLIMADRLTLSSAAGTCPGLGERTPNPSCWCAASCMPRATGTGCTASPAAANCREIPDLVFAGRQEGHLHQRLLLALPRLQGGPARAPRPTPSSGKRKEPKPETATPTSAGSSKCAGWEVLTVWECELKDRTALEEQLERFLAAR